MFVKQCLACQGDRSRCYNMSKLPQLLYTFYSRCKPNPSATPLPRLLEITFTFWMTFTLRYFLSFCTYHIPYGMVIWLSPHCKIRSQILLSPYSKGFLSYLKERFLHSNKRKIWVLCAAFKVLYVYYYAFYPKCIVIIFNSPLFHLPFMNPM